MGSTATGAGLYIPMAVLAIREAMLLVLKRRLDGGVEV
jgi:hypothetical protein